MKNSISQLDQAYEICRKETQQWAKTFYLGTLLLPLEKRKAIWAIYVWCRRTDEIMDSLEASTKSQDELAENLYACLLYTSPSPRDKRQSRMPSSA